jgi:hypothetical protein
VKYQGIPALTVAFAFALAVGSAGSCKPVAASPFSRRVLIAVFLALALASEASRLRSFSFALAESNQITQRCGVGNGNHAVRGLTPLALRIDRRFTV